jgi:hypothetical protein
MRAEEDVAELEPWRKILGSDLLQPLCNTSSKIAAGRKAACGVEQPHLIHEGALITLKVFVRVDPYADTKSESLCFTVLLVGR